MPRLFSQVDIPPKPASPISSANLIPTIRHPLPVSETAHRQSDPQLLAAFTNLPSLQTLQLTSTVKKAAEDLARPLSVLHRAIQSLRRLASLEGVPGEWVETGELGESGVEI